MNAESPTTWLKFVATVVPATVVAFLIIATILWVVCLCTLGQLPDFGNGG